MSVQHTLQNTKPTKKVVTKTLQRSPTKDIDVKKEKKDVKYKPDENCE